jgi:hypothetical protein
MLSLTIKIYVIDLLAAERSLETYRCPFILANSTILFCTPLIRVFCLEVCRCLIEGGQLEATIA